jgi:cytochrome oxidase Cu insertion factor (SCO1/SenC/PrrC family)
LNYPSSFQLDQTVQKVGYYDYNVTEIIKLTNKESGIEFATLTVSVDPNTATKCYTASSGSDAHEATMTKNINGNSFRILNDKTGDAAMGGERGQISEYRIMHGNNCYILNFEVVWRIVGYAAYANTGKSDATQAEVQAQKDAIDRNSMYLDQIANSFRFIN